jgi:hypothetical protein
MAHPLVAEGGDGLKICRAAANNSHEQPTKDGPQTWALGEGLTPPHRITSACYEILHKSSGKSGLL